MRFVRATRGAALGVEAGTCAWQDRGIAPAEPAAMCFQRVGHLSFDLSGSGALGWLRLSVWGGDAPVIFWEGGERPDGAAFRLGNTGELQYYRAYQDASRGCLLVTRVGP